MNANELLANCSLFEFNWQPVPFSLDEFQMAESWKKKLSHPAAFVEFRTGIFDSNICLLSLAFAGA